MIGIAVVGYGYWGPNLVRNLWDTPGARLLSVCDLMRERLAGVQSRYPAVDSTDNLMFASNIATDPTLTSGQIALVRWSKHCVYF